ncbi:MAG TPA: FrgA protein, partial [Myxococcaceae bacterium]|nr:FrgA protein [Myxococcaceae bacterium]
GSDDGLCAQAAADALREITRASFGSDQRRWASWWAENRSRSRAEWLVAALRHPELEVRLAAIEELSKALSDTLGYFADAPPAERDAAAKRWDGELTQNPRLRNLQ